MSAETNQFTDIPSGNAAEKKPAPKAASGAPHTGAANAGPRKVPPQGSGSGPKVIQDTAAWPNVDVVKYFDESRERLKDAFEQATGRFEHVRCAARDTSEVLQDCHTATIAGLKEINEHALEGVQSDMDRLFDYGRQLSEVKSVPEVLEAHSAFVREAFETHLERVRSLSEMSANLFKSTFEPFQSGMANVLSQAKKRAE